MCHTSIDLTSNIFSQGWSWSLMISFGQFSLEHSKLNVGRRVISGHLDLAVPTNSCLLENRKLQITFHLLNTAVRKGLKCCTGTDSGDSLHSSSSSSRPLLLGPVRFQARSVSALSGLSWPRTAVLRGAPESCSDM